MQRLLRRVAGTTSRPSTVRNYLRTGRVRAQLKVFARQFSQLVRTRPLQHWAAKRLTLRLLAVSRRLQYRSHFATPTLRHPAHIRAVWRPRRVRSSRSVRRARYFSLLRRAKRLQLRQRPLAPLLFAGDLPYHYPMALAYKGLSEEKRAFLDRRTAILSLFRSAFARGVRRVVMRPRTYVSRQLLHPSSPKLAQARTMFRLYASTRFVHMGKRGKPRFNRARRIVQIYQQRRAVTGRKLVRVTRRMHNYRCTILRIKQRVAPARLLKIARSGKLMSAPRRFLLQH